MGYTPLELLTIHPLQLDGFNFRHDPDAMADCKMILEDAIKKNVYTAPPSMQTARNWLACV